MQKDGQVWLSPSAFMWPTMGVARALLQALLGEPFRGSLPAGAGALVKAVTHGP